MKSYPLWKSILVLLVILMGIIFAIPSLIYDEDSDNWFLKNKINLGLDLQGGSYLLLEIDNGPVEIQKLQNTTVDIRNFFKNKKIIFNDLRIENKKIIFRMRPHYLLKMI